MNWFPVTLAWREGRSSIRRVGFYMLSITLGVAALVSIHSFRQDVQRSVQAQSQVLLGADVVLRAGRVFPDSVNILADSLVAAGHATSSATTVPSMVLAPASGLVRLLQVRGITGGWPLYGGVITEPAGLWGRHMEAGSALVDPAVLTQLDIQVGDSLVIGDLTVGILGMVRDLPTDIGFQTAIGPRVYISEPGLEAAGILGFGNLARYTRFFVVPEPADRETLESRYEEIFEATSVGFRTAEEQAEDLTESVGFLGQFLGLVGLAALLLGGIGVGSAIHVFVKERITEVAVLRCIGARQGSVFTAYLLQAGALGLMGASLGAALGVVIQRALPSILAGVLPVDVDPRFSAVTVLGGLGIGVWVSLVFALLPLLKIRDVPPLGALRQDFEEEGSKAFDPWRPLAMLALAGSVVVLSMLEAPSALDGVYFAGALGLTTLLLWITGLGTIRLSRRLFPARAPYVIRQGFSNLFRPQNQTVAVILAVGFGVFVIATIVQVQGVLTDEFAIDQEEGRPNLLLFDIQSDQTEGVLDLLPAGALDTQDGLVPLVPSRLVAIKGVDRRALEALGDDEEGPERWALRREYRHTFRGELTDSEELVEGRWWPEADPVDPGVARVSLDMDLAGDLGVGVGDRLTWDVSGIEIESQVASLRSIDWAQFRTNFFVVFEPGSLDEAPSTHVALVRIPDETGRDLFQRELVRAFPNVSVLDITRVQETLETILGQVDRAIRFLAGFAALAGLLVLVGTLASSRHHRRREGALLKTLGARRAQVLAVLLTEYLALGALAATTGLLLATAAAGALVVGVFELPFVPHPGPMVALWLGVSLVTLLTGVVGSRDLLEKPPLPVLREE